MTTADISNPIHNSPYDPPAAHFEIGAQGPTGVVLPGRRPSESFVPVPPTRKASRGKAAEQQALDFDLTGERRERHTLINDIRREVERWRAGNWNGVTPYTRKLLAHWAAGPPTRDDPVLFCQREAAETAIFLAEVAGRHGTADYRCHLEPTTGRIDHGLAEALRARLQGSNVEVVEADATELPLESDRFSAATTFTTLHHVPSAALQDRLLAELCRVLRPAGLLVGTDGVAGDELDEFHVDDIFVPCDPDEMPARLHAAGFVDVQVDRADPADERLAWARSRFRFVATAS